MKALLAACLVSLLLGCTTVLEPAPTASDLARLNFTLRLLDVRVCRNHETGYWAVHAAATKNAVYYLLFLVDTDYSPAEANVVCRVEWDTSIRTETRPNPGIPTSVLVKELYGPSNFH